MNNIGSTPVAGETHLRARQIVLDNPFGAPQRCSVIEEKVTTLNNGAVFMESHFGGISFEYQMGYTFPLINPMDNTPLPDAYFNQMARGDQLMVLAASMYLDQVNKRAVAP